MVSNTFSVKNVKGQTREYRKALRSIRVPFFPRQGAFHVIDDEDGRVVLPSAVGNAVFPRIVSGPAPTIKLASSLLLGYFGEEADPCRPTEEPVETPDLPPLPPTKVYKKTSGVRSNGKTWSAYREVRNPKGGQVYYVRKEVAGKVFYQQIDYSDILNSDEAA